MSPLVERLAQLRRHLEHLDQIRSKVSSATALSSDLSLHNDVLFSLLTVCQLVIDISADLASRRGIAFADYTEAVKALARFDFLPNSDVESLAKLPGFRNVLIHEYVVLEMERVLDALDTLEPVRRFADAVAAHLDR